MRAALLAWLELTVIWIVSEAWKFKPTAIITGKSDYLQSPRFLFTTSLSAKKVTSRNPGKSAETHPISFSSNKKVAERQTYRIFNVEIPLNQDPGKDDYRVHEALRAAVTTRLKQCTKSLPTQELKLTVCKKSFDGRWKKSGQPRFIYTVDIELPGNLRVFETQGKVERILPEQPSEVGELPPEHRPSVVIVGSGPAGLFCALDLVEVGIRPIIVERGQPVEIRGRDIGALINRRLLKADSNLCYGEGGAGTWSDGKLTTRIGKNSEDVRSVLRILVDNGAPSRILVDGKPHLGTDRLVRILRSIRERLVAKGAQILFNTTVVDISINGTDNGRRVSGVVLANGEIISAAHVVLAVGHSGRKMYECLLRQNVSMQPKGIAVGFRVEHPQELINSIQYGEFGALCERGKGPVPVADYRLVTDVNGESEHRSVYSFCMCPGGQIGKIINCLRNMKSIYLLSSHVCRY